MEYQVDIQESLYRSEYVEAPSNRASQKVFPKQIFLWQKPLPLYYKSPSNDFNLLHGDTFELLPQFDFKFDMIFADPPYFLSNGGISIQSGKVVCVDKGE